MESALDVLSRAATMVQDNANETRLSSKELPTTAWRRERRLRTGEYHHPQHHSLHGSSTSNARSSSPCSSPPPAAHVQPSSISSSTVSNAHPISIMMAAAAATMRPLSESTNYKSPPSPPPNNSLTCQITHPQALQHINLVENDDVPLDMSVGNLKQRNSPPPPYREPLPGSQFSSTLARPSVITQAPPKRDSTLVSNRENDNRSCESIDEHFRRSLGNDYFALFSKRSPACQTTKTPSPQPQNLQPPTAHVRSPSPALQLSSERPLSALSQTEMILPPAYPVNLPSENQQQIPLQAHHNQLLITPKTGQMKITRDSDSPPLPLVVRQPKLQPIALHNSPSLIAITPLTSPQSPGTTSSGIKLSNNTQTPIFGSTCSRSASPLTLQQHQLQSSSASVSLTQYASVDNSPSSSPRHTPPVVNVPVPKPSPNLPAIMRIKTEPGLQNVKSHNPTPPASPTSTTNLNINSNSTSYSSNTSSPSSPIISSWKSSTNTGNASAEILASVDDHFAKALGDTWKKLQEKKEMRK
ncbi:tondu-domain-containing Growth Inhibitor isoform 2-T3 [Cochliomyia hominivorax]